MKTLRSLSRNAPLTALFVLTSLLPIGCGGSLPPAEEATADATSAETTPARPRLTTLSFTGRIRLSPAEGFAAPRGAVYHHVYFLDGQLFDALTCYVDHDHCAVFDLHPSDQADRWEAHVADSESTQTPITLHFDFRQGKDWTTARRVQLTVTTPEHGEAGVTNLRRDESVAPPTGLRSRLRARERLRDAFESIEVAYHEPVHEERVFPESRAPVPSAPPCEPILVEEQESVEWLGLTAPVVLNWAYSLEGDEEQGTLRLMARRDEGCDGTYEAVMLEAERDEYGDLTLLRP